MCFSVLELDRTDTAEIVKVTCDLIVGGSRREFGVRDEKVCLGNVRR